MTIACGDSHTSTHGAFGAIAFGIGTSQVRDVLASQCLALDPLKVRRIDVNGAAAAGRLREGRDPDDHPPARREGRRRLRVRVRRRRRRSHDDGRADDDLQHVDRGRRARRLRQPGRDDVRVPARARRSRRRARRSTAPSRGGASLASDPDAAYDDASCIDAGDDRADGHLGHQSRAVGRRQRARCPTRRRRRRRARGMRSAEFMGFEAGQPIAGTQIDVAFIGSCTNGRLSDLRGGRAHRAGPPRRAARQGAGRARLAGGAAGGRARRAATRSSSTPASSGAAPAARCAWR